MNETPLHLEPEIGWFLASVCSTTPVPLKDGSEHIQKDTVVAIKSNRSIWFARVLEISQDDLIVQYFDKCEPSNNQKYYLMANSKEHISKHMVICSGVPLQPDIFQRMEDGSVVWKLVLLYACYQNLSLSDTDMTDYPSKTYALCK